MQGAPGRAWCHAFNIKFSPKMFGNIFESTHFWLTQDLLQSYSSSPFPSFGKSASHKDPKKSTLLLANEQSINLLSCL